MRCAGELPRRTLVQLRYYHSSCTWNITYFTLHKIAKLAAADNPLTRAHYVKFFLFTLAIKFTFLKDWLINFVREILYNSGM